MIVALFLPAFAEPPAAAPEPTVEETAGREIRYRTVDTVDFTKDLDVHGELVEPQGNLLGEVRRAQFVPMIWLRTEWTPEMRASVDEIR